jgi:protease II
MGKSKKRGGEKEHRKRVKARNEKLKKGHWEFEALKKKIFEEAKQRHEEEQNKPMEIKVSE